MLLIINKEL